VTSSGFKLNISFEWEAKSTFDLEEVEERVMRP
jgi:hypothetical protein